MTILEDFPRILDILSGSSLKGSLKIDITTNFSRPVSYFAELLSIILSHDRQDAQRHLSISASFYPAYVSREEFTRKLLDLHSYRLAGGNEDAGRSPLRRVISHTLHKPSVPPRPCLYLSAGYPIITDDDFEGFLAMSSEVQGQGMIVRPIVIRNYRTSLSPAVQEKLMDIVKGIPQTEVTMADGRTEWFKEIQAVGAAIAEGGSFCPRGYMCDAGIHNLWVNALGEVYRCPAIGSDMRLGNLLEGDFKLLDAPAVCSSDHCSCNQFTLIERPA